MTTLSIKQSASFEVYSRILKLAFAAPLIFLIPVLTELMQHAAEYSFGMFSADYTLQPGVAQSTRTAFGLIKVLSIFFMIWFTVRWSFLDGDTRQALKITKSNLKLIAIVILANIGISVFTEGFRALISFIPIDGLGSLGKVFLLLPDILSLIPSMLLLLWCIAAIAGDQDMTARKSIKLVRGRIIWVVWMFIISYGPLFAAHYAINTLIVGLPEPVIIVSLILDSILVGALATVMGNCLWIIYRNCKIGIESV
jgi:hypothetical protein